MKTLPLFLKTTGQRIAVIGGGEQATQKARLALKTDARVTVFATALNEELEAARAEGRLQWVPRLPLGSDLTGFRIVFVALDCPGAGAAMATLGREAGAIVNMVDAPAWSDAYTPSIVDRDPIIVAIGTEGKAPMLGRRIRGHLEEMLPEGLGAFAAYAGALRPRVARHLAKAQRMGFWRRFFSPGMRDRYIAGDTVQVEAWVDAALEAAPNKTDGASTKRVSLLVMPGVGDADLLSLRAARRLQETDLIIHPDGADPALLDMARRDAERRPVHAGLDGSAAPPRAIARIISEALEDLDDVSVLVPSAEIGDEIQHHLDETPGVVVDRIGVGAAAHQPAESEKTSVAGPSTS